MCSKDADYSLPLRITDFAAAFVACAALAAFFVFFAQNFWSLLLNFPDLVGSASGRPA
jgi:hypothetical protein